VFLFFLSLVTSFPAPGFPDTDSCDRCDCSVKNWVCNIKCPEQTPGSRQVCDIEENQEGSWVPSQTVVRQSANNFCQKAQIFNEKAHLAVGNFFEPTNEIDFSKTLECQSIRLGDENRRQKIQFDLIPPLRALSLHPSDYDLVIYERGNGTRDGQLNSLVNAEIPSDGYLPEAFAFSLLVDGTWTKYFYSGVLASFVEFKEQLVPDWKNPSIAYHMELDAWSTPIQFRWFDIADESLVSGISIMNLQPGDMILGPIGSFGEVVLQDQVDTVCSEFGACSRPQIADSFKTFSETDYDPDIVWIGPYTGQPFKRRNF